MDTKGHVMDRIGRTLVCLALLLLGSHAAGIRAETVVYYHTDALGSPVAVTDADGNIIERTQYAPYGATINRPLHDGPGYTGHETDAATGLVYAQQRYYDPAIGRFLSVDPVTADTVTGWNFNRYNYAANNPYKFKDPDGRIIDTIWDVGSLIYDLGKSAYGGITGDHQMVREGLVDAGVDGASMLIPFVPAGASKVARAAEKAATLERNVARGAKAEKAVAEKLGEQVAGKRVTLEASTGQRSVADIVTKDKGVVEVKSGNAQLSPGQKAIRADVEAGRPVTPRGQNATNAGLEPGKPTQMKCYSVERC